MGDREELVEAVEVVEEEVQAQEEIQEEEEETVNFQVVIREREEEHIGWEVEVVKSVVKTIRLLVLCEEKCELCETRKARI